MAIKVKNNSKRLMSEIWDLKRHNRDLLMLLLFLRDLYEGLYLGDIIITHIYRTPEEQRDIYKDTERYKLKPFTSPHQYYQAVDISCNIVESRALRTCLHLFKQYKQVSKNDAASFSVFHINDLFNKTNYYKYTAKRHDVGRGDHIHIQYLKEVKGEENKDK